MTAQDKIEVTIGKLTVNNFALQEQVENLQKEIEELKGKPKLEEVKKYA